MKKLLLSITIIIFSTFLFSCSKDDTASDSIDENGGQIYRYQVVTINVGSTSLTNNVYLGTLAGTTVELTKVADHELVFYVPETTPIGATELHINSLNNAKINYEVKDVILTQSVDETLAPLETNFENYGNQLSTASQDIPFVQNHSTMMSYYNGLSIEEKSEVAKFYKVNKTIIDAVYNTDYSTIQGRNIDMQENRALVLRFKAALAVGMIGSAVAVAEPSNIIRPIAIGVAIAGISAAVDYHFELIDRNINIIEMKINALTGTNNRNTNSQLSLTENVATTLPFNVNVRPIQETDSNSQQEYMKLYFATKNRLNELISNINEAILWVNNAIPFVSFDTLPLAQVSSSANPVTANVTSQIMQKINFSISHPNLSLETATLQSDGQLNLKVKFVGNPTATSISSTLNYTYNDDFSRFSGSFPIEVNTSSSNLLNFSFYDQYEISTCLGPTSFYCIWKHQVTFSGGTPIGGTIYHRTLWDSQNDGVFEGSTGYTSANVTNTNTSLNAAIYTVNILDNGYCWGNPNTQLRLEYYYVSPTGVESQHYFSPVPR